MSRRKQSNPKPLKVEEGWTEEEGGKPPVEKKVGEELKPVSNDTQNDNPTTPSDDLDEDNKEQSGSEEESCGKEKEVGGDGIKIPVFPLKRESKRDRASPPEEIGTSSQSRASDLEEFPEVETTPSRESDGRRKRRRESESSVARRKSPILPESGSELNGSLSVPMSPQQLLQGLPYLRLLPPSFRNDAARFLFMPPILPTELSGNGSTSNGPHDAEKAAAGENSRSGPGYVCKPCNIKFSSARTLDAHSTHYCSFRREIDKESVKSEVEADSKGELVTGSLIGSKKRERESRDEDLELMTDESMEISPEGRILLNDSNDVNLNKMPKTGKLYACMYCSYSADKKVSLNRHMRMHSGTTVTPSQNNSNDDCGSASGSTTPSSSNNIGLNKNLPEGVNALERYCQDCDIQFSSIKTYRVHKQYYCRTRHIVKSQQAAVAAATGSPPQGISMKAQSAGELSGGMSGRKTSGSPVPSDGSPASTPGPSQPFIVLPTNPLIIVPYCFIQAASILPGNVLPSQNVLVVLPNGSVQGSPFTSIPIPCPSPMSQGMASLLPQSAFSVNVKNNGGGGASVGTGCSVSPTNQSHSVFNDPKDVLRKISSANKNYVGGMRYKNGASDDTNSSQNINETVQSENGIFFQTNQASGLDEHSRKAHEEEDCEPRETIDEGMPAIDLTLRKAHSIKEISADDEKENRETCLQLLNHHHHHTQEQSDNSYTNSDTSNRRKPSAAIPFTDFHRDRELCSPTERLSSSSCGKRTPRPSSSSTSTSSTPPTLCEPKVNGVANRLSPVAVDYDITSNVNSKSHPLISMMMSPSMSMGKEGNGNGFSGIDMVKHKLSSGGEVKGKRGKISHITTQLPGGAILTTSSGSQSLTEMLMPNSPELSEILAKISPQLLVNSRSTPGSPIALNPAVIQALSQTDPEILMRMFDSAYLTNLQQTIQQQQQQQGVKRGYSKCVECDIVFYKFENYLVHKEHYCAARGANNSPTSTREMQSSRGGKDTISSRISSCSSPAKSELDADESQSSHSSLAHRTQSSNSQHQMSIKVPRKSTDSGSSDFATLPVFEKTKSRSPQASSIPMSPVPSPSERKGQNVVGSQYYPCVHCGVKYSTNDNLKAHQNFYCTKKRNAKDSISSEGEDVCVKSEDVEGFGLGNQGLSNIKGLLQCSKCKLAIPEDQIGTHSKVCLGINGVLPYGSGGGGGPPVVGLVTSAVEGGGKGVGWKCPCCPIYSPTVSQAQKHLEQHSGVRSFKCLLCGYRGNTLRGMRTHIRTHFDKRVSDLVEADYMCCITANDVEPNVSTPLVANKSFSSTSDTRSLGLNHQQEAVNRQAGRKIKLNHSSPSASVTTTCSPSPPMEQQDIKIFSAPEGSSLAMDEDKVENNNQVITNCSLCDYTSSYRGNIIRHMKLVHKIPEQSADKIISEMNLMQIHSTTNNVDYKDSGDSKLNLSLASQNVHIKGVEEEVSNNVPSITRSNSVNGRDCGRDEKSDERNCTSRSASTEEDMDGLSTLQKKEKACAVLSVQKSYCSATLNNKATERAETPVQ